MSGKIHKMTFEEFKEFLFKNYGERNVILTETGKHGWTSVEDVLDKKPGGNPGPHWCDAGKRDPNSLGGHGRYLYGKYDFNAGIAVFYNMYNECKSALNQLKI